MRASLVRTQPASASTGIDLFLGPVVITLALLFSLLLPLRIAHAQLSGAAGVDYAYQRSMSRIIAGSASGLQVSSNSTLDIINGGRKVGSIALKEKRLIDLATMAGRAASIPGMIAIGATVLLQYGLEKCADGTWCKPAQGEQAPNGKPYPATDYAAVNVGIPSQTIYGSGQDMCQALVDDQNARGVGVKTTLVNVIPRATYYGCVRQRADDGTTFESAGQVQRYTDGVCYQSGSTKVNGQCVPPGYTPGTQPTPATSDEINQAWQRAMQANPAYQQQYWGFEDPAAQNAAWANAMAQLAEVIGTGTVQDVGPTTSTTDSAGKVTKKQTTCTYTGTANPDMATAKDKPIQVGQKCVTTTTNPDGTTSTETTETGTAPATGTTPPKVEVETCGLPGKPACKIDETGTAEGQKTETASVTSQAMDAAAKTQTDAVNTVLNGEKPQTDWFGWLPQIPRSECKPISVSPLEVAVEVDWCPAVGYMQILSTAIWAFTVLGFSVAEVKDALNGA